MIIANFSVLRQITDLRHIGKKAHHLASITRVIVFAVRPFALLGRVRGKPAAFSSHNRVYTVPCSVFLCPVMCRAAFRVLSSLCLLLCFVLNCVAKVQRYLQPTKRFTEKVCIFNLLQQIRLFLPKFIHILSTNLTKCAIYKANFFAFRLQYAHTRTRTYIKTNNRLPLQSVCVCLCSCLWYLQPY